MSRILYNERGLSVQAPTYRYIDERKYVQFSHHSLIWKVDFVLLEFALSFLKFRLDIGKSFIALRTIRLLFQNAQFNAQSG